MPCFEGTVQRELQQRNSFSDMIALPNVLATLIQGRLAAASERSCSKYYVDGPTKFQGILIV